MVEGVSQEERIFARRWWTLGTLCLSLIVIGVDNTILNVALPSIARSLRATGSQLQWMVDGYTIIFACFLLTAGSLGDRYGRRHALRFGIAWFGFFSAMASMSHSPVQLIFARGLMGFGAAFIYPTTLSILTNTFLIPEERAKAIGIWAGVAAAGIALGPVAGGLLVERFGWSSVFLVNVPICTIALIAGAVFIPNTGSKKESPLDPVGAGFSTVGLVCLLYGVIEGPDRGWTAPIVMEGLLVGALLLALFAWWEWRSPAPMMDVRVFRNPRFSAASATISLTFFALFSSTFLLTLYFQFVLGYSAVKAGAMFIPYAFGMMIGAPNSPRLVRHFGTKRVVMGGLTLVFFAMAAYGSDTLMSSLLWGGFLRFVAGLGMGMTTPPVTESIMGSLPTARAGVGSAVNDTTRQTGGAVGVAVVGSIFAARYHAAMGSLSFIPAGLRASARESIGTSLQAAQTAGGSTGRELVAVAHHAFLTSMRVTYAVAVMFVALAIVVTYRFLPARELTDTAAAPHADELAVSDGEVVRGLELGMENAID